MPSWALIGGLMGDPHTATRDPVFWLHHANIDRIWWLWTQGGGAALFAAVAQVLAYVYQLRAALAGQTTMPNAFAIGRSPSTSTVCVSAPALPWWVSSPP